MRQLIVKCNGCETIKDVYSEWFHYKKTWGYFGVSDMRTDIIDLCHMCYTKWINTLKIHPMTE